MDKSILISIFVIVIVIMAFKFMSKHPEFFATIFGGMVFIAIGFGIITLILKKNK